MKKKTFRRWTLIWKDQPTQRMHTRNKLRIDKHFSVQVYWVAASENVAFLCLVICAGLHCQEFRSIFIGKKMIPRLPISFYLKSPKAPNLCMHRAFLFCEIKPWPPLPRLIDPSKFGLLNWYSTFCVCLFAASWISVSPNDATGWILMELGKLILSGFSSPLSRANWNKKKGLHHQLCSGSVILKNPFWMKIFGSVAACLSWSNFLKRFLLTHFNPLGKEGKRMKNENQFRTLSEKWWICMSIGRKNSKKPRQKPKLKGEPKLSDF